jgi:hypothetical protein
LPTSWTAPGATATSNGIGIIKVGVDGSTCDTVVMYDPATDTREPLWCPENYRDYKGINCFKKSAFGYNGLLLERGYWMHPTDPNYIFVVNAKAIVRVDLKAGTSELFSY